MSRAKISVSIALSESEYKAVQRLYREDARSGVDARPSLHRTLRRLLLGSPRLAKLLGSAGVARGSGGVIAFEVDARSGGVVRQTYPVPEMVATVPAVVVPPDDWRREVFGATQ
jgi:hypothetical protein